MWLLGIKAGPLQEQQVLLASDLPPQTPDLLLDTSVVPRSGSHWAEGKRLVGLRYFCRLQGTVYSV